ncbi:rhomboid family intramembrane serine protease [candidate division KSB1 bacterium]|nr:rhomboid family intramembrane serine protease [candidate division KSB1 bacterium]
MGLYGQSYRFGMGAGLTTAVKYLIIANVSCFILQHLVSQELVYWFELVPAWVIHKFTLWQLFTYMFLHGAGIWHILINMLVLWMFGCELEREWGSKQFLLYYFVCGVGAGLFHVLLGIDSTIPVVGASGAIYGLLMAFGLLFPERIITFLILFILPVHIKAKYLVMIVAGISLFSGIFDPNSGVAHFAHLGGMIVGFLYLKMDWRWRAMRNRAGSWMSTAYTPPGSGKTSRGLSALKDWFHRRAEKRRHMEVVRRRQHEIHLRERVDAILDKINEVGYDNLTDEEKQILKRASQILSQEKMRSQDYGPN